MKPNDILIGLQLIIHHIHARTWHAFAALVYISAIAFILYAFSR